MKLDIKDRRYRIVPTIIGNRAKAWKLQHYGLFCWRDTTFSNGRVIETDRSELVGLIAHLRADISEVVV